MGTQHIDRASLCLSHFQGQNEVQGPLEGLMPGGEGVKQEDVESYYSPGTRIATPT